MKILITGGCGFLGTNIAQKILTKGFQLCIFDNLSRYGSDKNLEWLKDSGDFEFINGDIRKIDEIQKLVMSYKPDVIFHLAGQVAMTTSIVDPILDFEINAKGSLNLLESVRSANYDPFIIYSSTNKVYGDLEQFNYIETETRYICTDFENGFNEDVPLDFHSPYGVSKGCADQYFLDYARIYNIETTVFRHSSMYGGRQFSTSDQGWIGWFISEAIDAVKTKNSIFISGNGKQVRDLLYGSDMVDLYLKAINFKNELSGKAFNIGGGMENSLSILELFQILEDKINHKFNLSFGPPRESDQKVFVADTKKLRNIVNWNPTTNKYEGIDLMIDWIRNR
jgi:CDP-paratose 2-epimerase